MKLTRPQRECLLLYRHWLEVGGTPILDAVEWITNASPMKAKVDIFRKAIKGLLSKRSPVHEP